MRKLTPSRRERSSHWTKRVPSGRRVVLHVGCGPRGNGDVHASFQGPDWHEVRLDIDPTARPDIVSSIVDMGVVAAMSVDAVWSSHNLEHVYAHEVTRVLDEFHRVLRPGGVALIAVPDLREAAKAIAAGRLDAPLYQSRSGPITPLDMLYGHSRSVAEGNEFMAHRTGFTSQSLAGRLRKAGFDEIVLGQDGQHALLASGRRAR